MTDFQKYLNIFKEEFNFSVNNPDLFDQAFLHKSYAIENNLAKDNEILEFFGDAILKFAISDFLIKKFPNYNEGELTQIRAVLVSDNTLSELGYKYNLNHCLKLANNTKPKISIMAQAMEALIAAIYLDNDMSCVLAAIQLLFNELANVVDQDDLKNNFKARLQEIAQSYSQELPVYEVVKTTGPDHNRNFEVKVMILGQEIGRGLGKSKKSAEQAAAKLALNNIKLHLK